MKDAVTVVDHIDQLVTFDDSNRELTDAYLVISDGWIQSVGVGEVPASFLLTDNVLHISGRGLIAIPGLINTHHHFFQTFTRVLPEAQNVRLDEWKANNFRYWSHIDSEAVYVSAQVALGELALSGCSTTSDLLYIFPQNGETSLDFMRAEIEAAREIGMRFHPMRGAVDIVVEGLPKELVESTEDALLGMEHAIAQFHDDSTGSMCRVGLAPNALTMCSPEIFRESRKLSSRYGAPRHTHVAEAYSEMKYCMERFSMTPIACLDRLGWIETGVWLAHAVHVSPNDIALLASRRVGVAHCPSSNMRLGSGVAPIRTMIDSGVPVSLGVDGSASNNGGNLLGEVRLALFLARSYGRGELFDARSALRLATTEAAKVLGRDDIGNIRVGSQADVAFYRLSGVSSAGTEHDPVAALVMCWPPKVSHLMVQGRFVVWNGRLTGVDEDQIVVHHKEKMAYLTKLAGQ